MEIIWTGMGSAISGDPRLQATTYLWMFPIYGLAVFLEPLHDLIRDYWWYIRGVVWVIIIFAIEYVTGGLIRIIVGCSPWDYSATQWNISGLIRLDYAPVWFIVGMMFEQVHNYMARLFAFPARQ